MFTHFGRKTRQRLPQRTHRGRTVRLQPPNPRPRFSDQVHDHRIDQAANDFMNQARPAQIRIPPPHLVQRPPHKWHRRQGIRFEQAGPQRIVDVVIVVGDIVGQRGHLRFRTSESVKLQIVARVIRRQGFMNPPRVHRAIMLGDPFQRLPGEIQAVKPGIAAFETRHHPQRLGVMVEPAKRRHRRVQRFFTRMAERRVAQVMRQRQRLCKILVQPQFARHRPRDLRNFQTVRQARPVMIALVMDKNLRLVFQAAKRRRMHDPVAVALKHRAGGAFGFRMQPAAAVIGPRCKGSGNTVRHGPTLPAPPPSIKKHNCAALTGRLIPGALCLFSAPTGLHEFRENTVAHQVTVRNVAQTIEVESDETILDAAILAGIDYPCSCQSGTCGSCKSHLFSGEIEMLPYADFVLPDEERAEGLILACRALPRSDCAVGWQVPDEVAAHPRRVVECRVSDTEMVAADVCRVRMDAMDARPFLFSAGQYASLTFEGCPPRDFSMASRPLAPELEFHIRRLDDGHVSAFIADSLKRGDSVRLEGPFGTAFLRRKHAGPIIAIAGSTGLAPILSIVETALTGGMTQPIHLYFGARSEAHIYATEHLAALARSYDNLTVEIVLSETRGPHPFRTGLVTDAVASDHARLDGAKAYVAGPPAMVAAAADLLHRRGIPRHDCHADAFFTEAEKAALETTP